MISLLLITMMVIMTIAVEIVKNAIVTMMRAINSQIVIIHELKQSPNNVIMKVIRIII